MNRNPFERPNLVLNWPRYHKNHVLPWLLQRPDKRHYHLLPSNMRIRTERLLMSILTSLLLLFPTIMALNFTIFPSEGTHYVKSIANSGEPFPTGAKQRDQVTYCGILPYQDVQIIEIGLQDINFLKESHDPSNSWHSACFARFMPDVVNIMLLKISLRNFESQEKLLQLGPEILLIMNHHDTHYYVDVKVGACIVSTHDEVRRKELRDNNIFYQEGLPYLIPAVGSSRALEGALEACDTTYGHLPAHYYQPRTPMILCNYYRAWILGNSIMALIFATFSPKGTQDIKLIANINEPFPTGAKQRDQTDCGNLPSHYIEISRRKKQSTQVSMIQRWVGGSFLEARHSSVDYDFGSDLCSDSGRKLNRVHFRLCTPGVPCNKEYWKHTDADISSWKESGNHIRIVQGCRDPVGINSCYAAYHTSLNYDNVIILVAEGSLRLSIGIWNRSPKDVSSATQDWKSGYPLLEGNCAYLPSYILEPHFTPELAEVGLLPPFGTTRMTHLVNGINLLIMDRRRQLLSELSHLSQCEYG